MRKQALLLSAWAFLIAGVLSLSIDKQVSILMSSIRNPLMDIIMIAVTNLGSMLTGLPFLFALVVVFEKTRKKQIVKKMALVIILDIIAVFFIKLFVSRDRPHNSINGFGTEKFLSSFPSGHSTFIFSLMSTFDYYYSRPLFFFAVASLVSFSRVYLQLHYLSDVLVGAAMGLVVYWYVVEEDIIEKTAKRLKMSMSK